MSWLRLSGLLALLHGCALFAADESPPSPIVDLAARLRADVTALAQDIGTRHVSRGDSLTRAEKWIATQLTEAGYTVMREPYELGTGREVANLVAEIAGNGPAASEVVIVGAHYDTVLTTPGADDNASGVAAMLALARSFAEKKPARAVRFVAFAQEEPGYFQSSLMGSRVYARQCRERGDNITAMLSLETLGYYSDAPKSQKYPPIVGWFYPSTGNFIAFVGDRSSKKLVKQSVRSFRTHSDFPAEAAALPRSLPGIGWSDHWSFWQEGYPAIMVTDTAPFRNPHYHQRTDTVGTLDFESMARVVLGLRGVLTDLATPAEPKAKK